MHKTGRTALITGGAQGIGKAIAGQLLKNGYAVAVADIDREAGQETAAEYGRLGKIIFIHTDVSREPSVRECIKKVITRFKRLDVLVNNAAALGAGGGPVEKLKLAAWNRVIGTNLTGAFLMAKHAACHLRKVKGSIVNIASTRALQSEANTEAYSASKGGLVALTHALALSLGPAVRVNCVSPGWIETCDWKKRSRRKKPVHSKADHAQHPAGRVGVPEDIAGLVGYLVSDTAGFITGQNLVADGGMTKKMIYVE